MFVFSQIEHDFKKLYQCPNGSSHSLLETIWPSLACKLLDVFQVSKKKKKNLQLFLEQYETRIPIIIERGNL